MVITAAMLKYKHVYLLHGMTINRHHLSSMELHLYSKTFLCGYIIYKILISFM